jgi:hypothetical protein
MNTKTNLKAGAITSNHNQTHATGLRVKTQVKAGGYQHNQSGLPVKSRVKAGGVGQNHNQSALPAGNRGPRR